MHEVSICESIIDILKEQAAKEGASRVTSVVLKVGEMAGVVEGSMRFAFEVVSKDTLAEGAELIIHSVPLTARCSSCGTVFPIEGYAFSCALCGSPQIMVVSGRELIVEELEME
jgi:hydrogenase nickel incorporation protein HypA/HybF